MKKGIIVLVVVAVIVLIALYTAGVFKKSSVSPESEALNEARVEVDNVADLQTLIREQALLIVEAGTSGLDPLDISQWKERGQAAAQKVSDGDYESARVDLESLNAEMRAELDTL